MERTNASSYRDAQLNVAILDKLQQLLEDVNEIDFESLLDLDLEVTVMEALEELQNRSKQATYARS